MSTRSFVGTIDTSTGEFKGRYVHSDGYPSYQAATLTELIAKRDGDLPGLLKIITEDYYGWSCLNPNQAADARNYLDDRGVNVEGVGVAYTTAQGQSTPEEWVAGTLGGPADEDWGTEWGYVFDGTDPGTAKLYVIKVENAFQPIGWVEVRNLHQIDWNALEAAVYAHLEGEESSEIAGFTRAVEAAPAKS